MRGPTPSRADALGYYLPPRWGSRNKRGKQALPRLLLAPRHAVAAAPPLDRPFQAGADVGRRPVAELAARPLDVGQAVADVAGPGRAVRRRDRRAEQVVQVADQLQQRRAAAGGDVVDVAADGR